MGLFTDINYHIDRKKSKTKHSVEQADGPSLGLGVSKKIGRTLRLELHGDFFLDEKIKALEWKLIWNLFSVRVSE